MQKVVENRLFDAFKWLLQLLQLLLCCMFVSICLIDSALEK
jgi:hypothetical protein